MDDGCGGGPELDAGVRGFAADWREALRALPPEAFLTDPDTALAAAILFDQVPRNIYRGSAEAFAPASLARANARAIVAKGRDRDQPDAPRQYAQPPLPHSASRDHPTDTLRPSHPHAPPDLQASPKN